MLTIGTVVSATWVEKRCWRWAGGQWAEQTGLDTAYCRKYLWQNDTSGACNKQTWDIPFKDSLYYFPQTHSQGYWKNHPCEWPSWYSPNALFFQSGKTWMQVLNTSPSGGDAYYILAHQYIAAVLNRARGCPVPSEVEQIINSAANWFNTYRPTARTTTTQGQQANIWASRLDRYNNSGT
jgi:hypothetical protein